MKQHYDFSIGNKQAVILYKRFKDKSYFILASAKDVFGLRKTDNLRLLLIFSVLGGFLLSGLIAFFYVKQAMKPLEELKYQIEHITEKNLKQRITIRENDDEFGS
jgi:methyl-accepting chemotaxis protein